MGAQMPFPLVSSGVTASVRRRRGCLTRGNKQRRGPWGAADAVSSLKTPNLVHVPQVGPDLAKHRSHRLISSDDGHVSRIPLGEQHEDLQYSTCPVNGTEVTWDAPGLLIR